MLNDIKKIAILNKYNLAIFFLYVIICFIAMSYHEIWRDEARVWTFILYSENLKDLFHNIRYDGHPFLWYMIIYPFVKLGFSVVSMQIISVLLCSAAVLLFLFKSPFNCLTKILFVFSAGMVYYLPVISRNYSLVPICLFLLAYLYPNRILKPYKYLFALILLSQTHCYMWGLFCICAVMYSVECISAYLKEKNKNYIVVPILIIAYTIGMFFLYYRVFSHNIWNTNLPKTFFSPALYDIFDLKDLFLELFKYNFGEYVFYILVALCILITVFIFIRSKKSFVILTASLFWFLYISAKVWCYGIIYQKIYLIIPIIIFCYWITDKNKIMCSKISEYILVVFLAFIFFNPVFTNVLQDEIENTYTNTKEVSDIIKEVNKDEYFIISFEYDEVTTDNISIYTNHYVDSSIKKAKKSDKRDIKVVLKKKDLKDIEKLPKYIVTTDRFIKIKGLPYKKILSAPKNKMKLYNTNEYYDVYEKTE